MPNQNIEIARLNAHPANSNVMPEHLLDKLTEHIAKTGHYPPIIVRPIKGATDDATEPSPDKDYQILDGHHRVLALKSLGHESAECVVWQADDREALLLLATLNRLQGQDDPRKRAAIVGALADRHKTTDLAKLLPERSEQIKKLLEINKRPPAPRTPQPIEQMPIAVHFFLLPDQKRHLLDRLQEVGGTREEALMTLIDTNQ
jgi:ParB family transcriptional regulator, chromosome partitioning protein